MLLVSCSTNPEISEAYLSADGKTIDLGVNSCNDDLSVQVIESETTVEVTVTAKNDTNDACSDAIKITLEQPMGDRLLIDGSTGETLRVLTGEN